jgi:hypothetical protein
VKTSVLLFRKGGSTENVLFLHADNDGYKLDANHDTPIEADDLPAWSWNVRSWRTLQDTGNTDGQQFQVWPRACPVWQVAPVSQQGCIA